MILVEDDKKLISNKNYNKLSQKDVSSLTFPQGRVVGASDFTISPQQREWGRELMVVGSNSPKIFFIDFGLGFISQKLEDKAVDLHLLKQALEAKHFKNWEILWKEVEKGYKSSKDATKVLERLKAVERRGRYKH